MADVVTAAGSELGEKLIFSIFFIHKVTREIEVVLMQIDKASVEKNFIEGVLVSWSRTKGWRDLEFIAVFDDRMRTALSPNGLQMRVLAGLLAGPEHPVV